MPCSRLPIRLVPVPAAGAASGPGAPHTHRPRPFRNPLTSAARKCAVALGGLALLFGPANAQQPGAVTLELADAGQLEGRAYTLTISQDAALDTGADTHLVRDARLRFRFGVGERVSAARSRTLVVFDSARAAVSTPHGREVIDARPLVGRSISVAYDHTGGPAAWESGGPVIDFGDFGARQPVSALLDPLFPALAGRDVQVGDEWQRTGRRAMIDGNRWTETPVTTTLKLDRLESHGGVTLAHVTFRTTAAGPGAPSASGSIVIGIEDGIVREVALEDRSTGVWSFGEERLPFQQTTIVRITLDDARAGGHAGHE